MNVTHQKLTVIARYVVCILKKEIPVEVSGEKLTCICPQEWDPTTAPKGRPMWHDVTKENDHNFCPLRKETKIRVHVSHGRRRPQRNQANVRLQTTNGTMGRSRKNWE